MPAPATPRLTDPQFAARLLRPSRPRAAEVTELARTARSPAELLEACVARDLVPVDWVGAMRDEAALSSSSSDGPVRIHALAHGICYGLGETEAEDQGVRIGYYGCNGCHGFGYHRDAWTVPLVAALASDAAGVLRAEALAREFVARMGVVMRARARGHDLTVLYFQQWRAMARGDSLRAGWSLGDPDAVRDRWPWSLRTMLELLGEPLTHARDAERPCAETLARALALAGRRDVPDLVVTVLARVATLADRWDAVAAEGTDPGVRGANPFDPLLELWGTGYAFVTVTGSDAILLGAPAIATG